MVLQQKCWADILTKSNLKCQQKYKNEVSYEIGRKNGSMGNICVP